jgi:hypothetical protein
VATFILIMIIVPLISEKRRTAPENQVCEIDPAATYDLNHESWAMAFTDLIFRCGSSFLRNQGNDN